MTDSTLIPLDDRFALDPKRQCLIARTSAGDVVFRMYPKEGLTVDAYLTVLTVRGEQYNLMRKPASKAAQTAVTKLVEEAHTEAQRRGHLRTLETHAAHWWALNALERLDKEREEIEARLAELEAESVLARHVEMTTGMAVAASLAAMEAA